MPESTLNLDLYDLEAEVGDYLGYGMGARFSDEAWDSDQQRKIDKAVNSGLRMFYFTRGLPGIPPAYDWSFLQPTSTLTLPEATTVIPLPTDFAGINGRIIPASISGEIQYQILIVGKNQLYGSRAMHPTMTGRPTMAYVEPLKITETRSSRYQLQIHPIPDREYTLQLWYYIYPEATSEMLPYVYGGAAHAETVKAAVRAAAERDRDNKQADGPEWTRFLEQLAASIEYDRRFKPVAIGPNIDRSDDIYYRGLPYHRTGAGEYVPLLINGVESGPLPT